MNLHTVSKTLLAVAPCLFLPTLTLGLETASVQLPAGFRETAVRLPVEGYGGANRGQFKVDQYSGDFSRVESRLAIFDPLYASQRGTASFTLRGPGIDGTANAECSFKQNVTTAGLVSFDLKKFAFVCELTSASSQPLGHLTLGEPRPKGLKERLLARATRRGVAELGSTNIEIESVHEYVGSRLQSQAPVGYLLKADSVVIGALELTDVNPTVFIAANLADQERLSTLLAAIAVSLLRDPANSALAD